MRILRYLILCTIILLNGYRSSGQIVGVGSDKDTVSAYSAKDTIYVFNQYPNAKPGQLMEQYHAGDTATFVWSKFDTLTYLFDIPEKTDHNQPNSVINSLAQGGYRVIVGTSNTPIDTFYAWVYLNNPFTMKLNTDNSGNLLSFYRKCYYIDLIDSSTANHFTYYNPSDTLHNKITLRNHLSYVWSANPPLKVPMIVDTTAHVRIGIGGAPDPPYKNGKPPAVNTTFTIKATDRFNLSVSDSLKYITIQTWAYFHMSYQKFEDTTSAPFEITLIDSSQNAKLHKWYFGDGTTDTSYNPKYPHSYIMPKKDTIMLITTAPNLFCVDTFKDTIRIAYPFVGRDTLNHIGNNIPPNVFNPGNGNYKIVLASLAEFTITIYSRWGTKVYYYSGKPEEWEGWNGDNLIGGKAAPGIYYYVIQSVPFDPNPVTTYNANGEYKGFIYLFRND